MSYAHSKYWEDADFGQEYKRVRRKKLCTCDECKEKDGHVLHHRGIFHRILCRRVS